MVRTPWRNCTCKEVLIPALHQLEVIVGSNIIHIWPVNAVHRMPDHFMPRNYRIMLSPERSCLGVARTIAFWKDWSAACYISVSDKPFCKCPWSCHYGAWHRQRLFYPELFITPTNKLAKSIPCMELRQMGQPSFSEHVELFVVDATDYFWWYKIPAKCRTLVYFVCCCPKLFIRQLISFESTGIILGVSTEACSELCYDNRANHVYSVGMAYVSIRCTECRFG